LTWGRLRPQLPQTNLKRSALVRIFGGYWVRASRSWNLMLGLGRDLFPSSESAAFSIEGND
jgi:hypothetical protein